MPLSIDSPIPDDIVMFSNDELSKSTRSNKGMYL